MAERCFSCGGVNEDKGYILCTSCYQKCSGKNAVRMSSEEWDKKMAVAGAKVRVKNADCKKGKKRPVIVKTLEEISADEATENDIDRWVMYSNGAEAHRWYRVIDTKEYKTMRDASNDIGVLDVFYVVDTGKVLKGKYIIESKEVMR